ncbi:MAG: 2-hydroxycarboxylate transporter family protein [Eubacteriales bacterium]|nr:2-hydroxycarboxylate transporter family protein [Eubacteriales bacterium]
MSRLSEIRIAGFPLPLYLGILAVLYACMVIGCVPDGIVGGLLLLMVIGAGLDTLGKTIPVVRTYLGGSVACILGGAVLSSAGLIPQGALETADRFVNDQGFLIFYIAALICGSLFNIDRDLLLRATARILPTAIMALAAGGLTVGLLGMCMGHSFLEGILYIFVPMTSGGMTAGAVPLSSMYSQVLGQDAGEILTRIAPATVLGNVIAIVLAALANNFGRKHPRLTGNGQLINDGKPVEKRPPAKLSFANLATGLIISLAFYQVGELFHTFCGVVPTYAWMIILVVAVKSLRILSEEMENAARAWGEFAIYSWTAASLTGIGITLIDLDTIMTRMTPLYFLTVAAGVAAITLTAGFAGARLMGFYPLESAIAAGMCTTNMGGSGNVATLSSAERMELLPFAQIVTRSCGALMLTLGGILIRLLA